MLRMCKAVQLGDLRGSAMQGGRRWGGNLRAAGCSERSYEFMSCARCRVFSLQDRVAGSSVLRVGHLRTCHHL